MKIETLKKAEEFKQGHLNLVQYFLKTRNRTNGEK